MNRSELVAELAQREGISLEEAREIVDLVFDGISETLKNGERVEIRGFCTFSLKKYGGYTGMNPKTKKRVKVKPKKLPAFKPAQDLKRRVNVHGRSN